MADAERSVPRLRPHLRRTARAKFGRYHDQVAMVWFWGKIWLRTTSRRSPLEGERLGYFQGSFNVLIDALACAARAAGAELVTGRWTNRS